MTNLRSSHRRRLTASRVCIIGGALVAAVGAASATAVRASTVPPGAEPTTPPIAAEELTSLDGTSIRGSFSDDVTATVNVTREGMDPVTVDLADLSNVAVTRMTFQPGAQAPWHSHNGPVIVSVVEGELVYVMDDCSEHSYPAGSAFVDPGHGHVHTAFNPTDGQTILVNTFLEAVPEGPLLITEGVTAPEDNCGIPTTTAG
jgi:quercetin dioxygenase-like cupin family protein